MASRLRSPLEGVCGPAGVSADLLAGEAAAAVAAAIAAASRDAHRDEVRIARLIAAALEAHGLAESTDCDVLADAWGEADVGRISAVAGRAELLATLRARGLRLGIVSNTTTRGALLTAMLERFGILHFFDTVVYSSETGVRKPHAAIYEAALAGLRVAPSEAVFVGDRLREDVLGPAALGMTPLLTHELYQDAHNGEPFAVLQRLDEIGAVLDALSANTASGG